MLAAVSNTQTKPEKKQPIIKQMTNVDKTVSHLYRVIQKSTGSVGGYGHNGPIYGEITMGTFQKVVDALAEHTGFDASSSFVDIGSGLGKPNLHVALNPGVRLSYGVELEELRWQLSMHNLRFVLNEVAEMRKSVVYFGHDDATNMESFEPFTHVYMFDVGFPPAVLVSLANAFNISKSVKGLVSFQRPDRVIGVYGFNVDLITQITTRMNGSTETHTAYIYAAKASKGRRQLQIDFPSSPVKKASSASPTKTPVEEEIKSEENVAAPKATPLKLKLRGAKKALAAKQSPVKPAPAATKPVAKEVVAAKESPKKKGSAVLAKLQAEDYGFWVNNTGVIGGEGKRPQRTRKQVDLKKM